MASKKKVLVIGTGGTIAATQSEDGLKPSFTTEDLLAFFPEAEKIADVSVRQLFNIDSTNMQPHHWTEIADEIGREYGNYDGFVVTHGTDTMQYTAAALSFMLQNLCKPVVLTGSVKAIGEGSDAKKNFIDAVLVATSEVREVCIVFHGKIVKGCKARKVTNEATKVTNEDIGVYSSINHHLIGELIGRVSENHARKIFFEKGFTKTKCSGPLKLFAKIDNADLFILKVYPGLKPSIFDKLTDFKAILIEAYGPGNLPFLENSLVEKVEMLTRKSIPVFIATQNTFGEVNMKLYEVGRRALKAGAIPCNDMTSETAAVKLMWIMGNFGKDFKTINQLMLKDFVGEIKEG